MGEPKTQEIIVIGGATGSGKTGVALKLAEQFPVEIISADSRQIIKHLNIGTAKPTASEQAKVTFHLIDIVEPGERYSAFKFIDDANSAIKQILSRDKIPVVVGGTGLYINALIEGVVELEQPDIAIREKLEREMEEQGTQAMFDRLQNIDPLAASSIHPNNKVRVIRALEIYYLTGKTKSEISLTGAYRKSDFDFSVYCLLPDRTKLYPKIDQRVDQMMESGLLEELNQLSQNGLLSAIKNSNVIGYSELIRHLEGELTKDEAINQIKQNSRRFAKRQFTWCKNQLKGEIFQNETDLLNVLTQKLTIG